MTYEFGLSKTLERKLKKFRKKNKKLFLACRKKIIEIIENPTTYKHLHHDVRYRVHVGGSFVLSYRINEKEKLVFFIDVEHHDKAYK